MKNYIQEVEMTKEEKIKMYSKMSKIKLIEMLLENQRIVKELIKKEESNVDSYHYTATPYYTPFTTQNLSDNF